MCTNDEEVRLLYLLTGSFDILPFSYHKLRSYLNIHVSNIADQHNLKLKNTFKNRQKTCPYCYSPWSSETSSFKLLPSKKCRHQPRSKSYEDKTNKAKLQELRNTLVLKCKVCTKTSLFSLTKKKPEKEIKSEIIDCKKKEKKKKKKKKKKNKFSELVVNLKQPDNTLPEIKILKKNKRMDNMEKTRFTNPAYSSNGQSEPQKFTPISKSKVNVMHKNCEKLALNPFAVQPHNKFSRKKDNKLQRLKEVIKRDKQVARKSLKDFLTLV